MPQSLGTRISFSFRGVRSVRTTLKTSFILESVSNTTLSGLHNYLHNPTASYAVGVDKQLCNLTSNLITSAQNVIVAFKFCTIIVNHDRFTVCRNVSWTFQTIIIDLQCSLLNHCSVNSCSNLQRCGGRLCSTMNSCNW